MHLPAQVLFVLSADRPLSESEVKFLQYIRKWRKKVVFLVNKVDMLDGREQVGWQGCGGAGAAAVLVAAAFDQQRRVGGAGQLWWRICLAVAPASDAAKTTAARAHQAMQRVLTVPQPAAPAAAP